MNQVAVVIGGGQTLGAFLCHGSGCRGLSARRGCRYSERQSQPQMWPRKLTPNMVKEQRMALVLTPPASKASPLWRSRGVDEIFGRVDLLVYSAGIAKAAFISDFQLGDFDRSLQVNLVDYFLCAREFSRLMIRDGSSGSHYSRSTRNPAKWAANTTLATAQRNLVASGLTQSLALDLAEYGITVHSQMLGNLLKSPMFQSAVATIRDQAGYQTEIEVEQYYIDKVPLKRGCDYRDVLNVCCCSTPVYRRRTALVRSINVTGDSGDVLINRFPESVKDLRETKL
ncbi:SDR family NAD(P)-dependent oxidoreductase [Escherichia coli]|nr:SDR family NAD(P)-dependent oxidoreductase [Escherichia coli]